MGVRKPILGLKRGVSRKFNFLSSQKHEELQQVKLKKRTNAKMHWGVSAYNEWRSVRLVEKYDENVFKSDLNDLEKLEKGNLERALCLFVPEVTKSKGDRLYPGKTLYEMIVSIQKYLIVNRINWKLVEGEDFITLRTVLDNIMQERAAMNIGTVVKQAELITYEFEETLWQRGILGEDCPDRLRNTVLFLIGINLALCAGDEHYQLRCDCDGKLSQFSFERNEKGVCCLVYCEDTVTKTNAGGLKDMKKQRKVVWIHPSKDTNRCPVRLVDKYLSLCPDTKKKANFYLQSLTKTMPAQWYSEQVVGINSIRKVVKNLLSAAEIDGYFTNHSLRRTSSTRMFQAGIDRKIVKEITGHRSDAIDKYQVTSDVQKENVSVVIASKPKERETGVKSLEKKVVPTPDIPVVSSISVDGNVACSCKKTYQSGGNSIAEMIEAAIKSNGQKGKAKIKIEIDFCSE